MNFLIEFMIAFMALPVILLYVCYSMFSTVVYFFGIWFFTLAMALLYWGLSLLIFGRPDPDAEFENIFQTIANTSIAGIPTALALIMAAVVFLAVGAVSNRRKGE